jgi:tetratricopeptide (TPR) repeat protein
MAVDLMTDRAPVWERAAAMNNLGLALSDIGRHEEAVDALTQAVRDFEAVARTDQQTDNPSGTAPQRVMAHHNLGQVFASAGRHDEAVGVYRDALTTIDPQELPYQWGLIHHALGVSLTAVEDPQAASASFETALKVFSRMRHPFQHALAKNNVGLAYAQIGDVVSLRRAVTAFNDSMAVLDLRVHHELWQQAYANMQLAEQSLVQLGHDDTLTQHFVKLLPHLEENDRIDMMRDRLMRLLSLPEPQRGEALAKMDMAAIDLEEDDSIAVTVAGLAVLLELPDELLSLGLKSRMAAIGALQRDEELDDAAWVIEQSISGGMLAPQRIRLRDRLEELGYERR